MISHSQGKGIHQELDPKTYTAGSQNPQQQKIHSISPSPIVFCLDMTGSMLDWSKVHTIITQFILNKFPMFYGLVRLFDYVHQPAVSFCAIGDINHDTAPLQVSQFQEGKWIEFAVKNLFVEGGEAGQSTHESYELAAYFYNRFAQLKNPELGFFFIVGDESYEEHPDSKLYEKFLGVPVEANINAREEWKRLMEQYNVFHIKKEYKRSECDAAILQQWTDTIGKERVLPFKTSKACLDVVLGAIAITSGARTLEKYLKDMEDRAVPEDRIAEVRSSLEAYASAITDKRIVPVRGKLSDKKPQQKTESELNPPSV